MPARSPQEFALLRKEMVECQVRKRGVHDERILAAMLAVPRHEFVPPEFEAEAYADRPLPIGHGQTISQPFMAAAMAALILSGKERVLEVGTGSGYQAAMLSQLAREIHTIEMHQDLATASIERLQRLGCTNVELHVSDGTLGWAEKIPFDAILVTAAAPDVPPPLVQQLAEGGRLVIPVGTADEQTLLRIDKHGMELTSQALYHCRFVPLIGRYGWKPPDN